MGVRPTISALKRAARRHITFLSTRSFRRTYSDLEPLSRIFGYDRGAQSITRYYVDNFLEANADAVRGRVLEIGDNAYTTRIGKSNVLISDVLHAVAGNPAATVIGDLTQLDAVDENTYDCIILTQTLQVIYDVHAAIKETHRILKPGGVVLATISGISQISRYDMDRWGEFWRFTSRSAHIAFSTVFGEPHTSVSCYGNVKSACALLYGLTSSEIRRSDLDYRDPDYEVLVTIRATKALL